jgi:WD40 repeat protein
MQLTKHWAAQLDDYVIDLAWSPEPGARLTAPGPQPLLAAASTTGPVSLFSAADGARLHELPGHDNGTNALAWQPTHQNPAASSQKSDSESASLTSDLRPLTSVLATAGQDGAVKFWDASAGQHTATAALGSAWVDHLAWRNQMSEVGSQKSASDPSALTSDLRPLASGLLFASAGKKLFALRPDATVAHTFAPAGNTISALAPHPTGGAIAAAHFGGVEIWDADDFVLQKKFPYANGIHALVWSPDGHWLVSGNQDPSVHLWIPESDTELHMSGYESKVKHLSFDHTSRWLATSGGREVCVWDCSGAGPEGREPAMLPHESPVCAVAFQNRHGLLASASEDGVVQLWSPDRRSPLRATVRMPAAATKLAWSPDDRLLAIGTGQGHVFVLACEGFRSAKT